MSEIEFSEDLSEYLRRHGWCEEAIEGACDAAYYAHSYDDQERAVRESAKWMDDDEHDYSGELVDAFIAWQREVGERD